MKCCHSREWQCQTWATAMSWSVPGAEWLCTGGVGCAKGSSAAQPRKAMGLMSLRQCSDSFLGLLSVAGGHTHVPEQNRHSSTAIQMCLHHLPAEPGRCFNPGGFGYPRELGQAASMGCWWNRDSLEGVWGKPVRHWGSLGLRLGGNSGRDNLFSLYCCRGCKKCFILRQPCFAQAWSAMARGPVRGPDRADGGNRVGCCPLSGARHG